jgi:Protein of unknown function (DUF3455)
MRYISIMLLLITSVVVADEAPTAAEKEVRRLVVPEKLTPRGKSLLFLLRAEGVQVYRAEKKADAVVWVFQEPDAVLYNFDTAEMVGTHGKGPIWTDAGGKVIGKLVASVPAPTPTAIPWLLLETKDTPSGRFAKVTHIQRIDTWAGQVPKTPPDREGETKRVRYQATYAFWGER